MKHRPGMGRQPPPNKLHPHKPTFPLLTSHFPMRTLTIAALLTLAAASHADETVAAKATSGQFHITQEYHGDFIETVRFANTTLPSVRLSGMPWRGNYHISPDEQWLLRTQKTGSGESIAMLYHIEENGRISEVMGFDTSSGQSPMPPRA